MNEGMIERDPEAVMVWIFQLVEVRDLDLTCQKGKLNGRNIRVFPKDVSSLVQQSITGMRARGIMNEGMIERE